MTSFNRWFHLHAAHTSTTCTVIGPTSATSRSISSSLRAVPVRRPSFSEYTHFTSRIGAPHTGHGRGESTPWCSAAARRRKSASQASSTRKRPWLSSRRAVRRCHSCDTSCSKLNIRPIVNGCFCPRGRLFMIAAMTCPSISPESARLPDNGSPLRVVVGWDMANTEAVEFAAWLGRSLPVTVQVMSSTQVPPVKALTKATKGRKKWLKEAREAFSSRVESTLDQHLPRSQWSKHPARLVDSKDTVRSLYDTVEDFHADLILLGSRAKTPKGRFRPSSVADEMMCSCPVPLGLAPRGVKLSKKGVTRVTYAIVEGGPDDSVFSGLDYATALACALGLPLRIIAFSPTAFDQHTSAWNEETLGLLDRARDCAWALAAQLAPERVETFDVTSAVSSAKGWKRSIDSVKWKKGDIMCLGSQPSGQLRSVFVGTREGEFIRYASVPVIVCPRAER